MKAGSIVTLRRATYTYTYPATPRPRSGIRLLDGIAAFVDRLGTPRPPKTYERSCFSLLLGDGSEKRFDFQPQVTETEALQEAVNFAVAEGFYADAKSIGLFSDRRIPELFFQNRPGSTAT